MRCISHTVGASVAACFVDFQAGTTAITGAKHEDEMDE